MFLILNKKNLYNGNKNLWFLNQEMAIHDKIYIPKYKNWKEINITGLEKYEISNLGNIRNVKNKRLLKNYDRKDSYSSIYLCKKSYSIHRLVGITFLPNPDNKPTINHIDKNKYN